MSKLPTGELLTLSSGITGISFGITVSLASDDCSVLWITSGTTSCTTLSFVIGSSTTCAPVFAAEKQ